MRKVFKVNLEFWAFAVSALLLLIAIVSAWSVFMEAHTAAENADEASIRFDYIVLKNEANKSMERYEPVTVSPPPMETTDAYDSAYSPIAKIQAKRIGLNVSVLSEWSYELLDISVNKFSGPDPNESGNSS